MQGVRDSVITKRATGRGMTGKGDRPRPGVYSQEFRDNFDKIFGARRRKNIPKSYTIKLKAYEARLARLKSNEGALSVNVDKDAQKDKNV